MERSCSDTDRGVWSVRAVILTGECGAFVQHWWNETDRGNTSTGYCHFVHPKSHVDWPGTELGSPRLQTGGSLPQPRHGQQAMSYRAVNTHSL